MKLFKVFPIFLIAGYLMMVFTGVFAGFVSTSFGQMSTSTMPTSTVFTITGGFASNIIKEEKGTGTFGAETYKATITWATDRDSDSHVVASYNLIGDYLLPPFVNADNNTLTKNHSIDLTGLSSGKTYYYYVYSKDAAGNTATTDQGGWIRSHSFVTPGTTEGGGGTGGIGGVGGTGGTQTGGNGYIDGTGGTGGTIPPPPQQTPPAGANIGGTAPIVAGEYGVSVLTIFKYAMGFIGLVALGAVIYGGILRITAAANPSNIKEGNDYILGAIAGIALLAGAAIIFNTINPQIGDIESTEEYLSSITTSTPSTYTFDSSLLLGSSTLIESASMMVQNQGMKDSDVKAQMKQDGIAFSSAANFSGMTLLQYDRLRAIATNVYSTSDNKNINILATASTTNSFTVNLKKSADPNNLLNIYFKDNLGVWNFGQKLYTLPLLPGQGNVKDMDSFWAVVLL